MPVRFQPSRVRPSALAAACCGLALLGSTGRALAQNPPATLSAPVEVVRSAAVAGSAFNSLRNEGVQAGAAASPIGRPLPRPTPAGLPLAGAAGVRVLQGATSSGPLLPGQSDGRTAASQVPSLPGCPGCTLR